MINSKENENEGGEGTFCNGSTVINIRGSSDVQLVETRYKLIKPPECQRAVIYYAGLLGSTKDLPQTVHQPLEGRTVRRSFARIIAAAPTPGRNANFQPVQTRAMT